MKIKKSYRLLLSALLFTGILLLQFHFHEHEDSVEHCPVCLIQEVFDLADTPISFSLVFVPFIFVAFLTPIISAPVQISYAKRSRSPPSHA